MEDFEQIIGSVDINLRMFDSYHEYVPWWGDVYTNDYEYDYIDWRRAWKSKIKRSKKDNNNVLQLQTSYVDDEGIGIIVKQLEKCNWKGDSLLLNQNSIRDGGAEKLFAFAVSHENLTCLDLRDNEVSQCMLSKVNTVVEQNLEKKRKRIEAETEAKRLRDIATSRIPSRLFDIGKQKFEDTKLLFSYQEENI